MDFLIKVHDTGIGIEPAFLEKIFLPFEQESRDVAKKMQAAADLGRGDYGQRRPRHGRRRIVIDEYARKRLGL